MRRFEAGIVLPTVANREKPSGIAWSPASLFARPTVWDWRSHRRVLFLKGVDDDEIGHLPREGWCLPSIARPELDRRRFA